MGTLSSVPGAKCPRECGMTSGAAVQWMYMPDTRDCVYKLWCKPHTGMVAAYIVICVFFSTHICIPTPGNHAPKPKPVGRVERVDTCSATAHTAEDIVVKVNDRCGYE